MKELTLQLQSRGVSLHGGASEEQCRAFEAELKCTLPPQLRELYRRCDGYGDPRERLNWRLMSIEEAEGVHKEGLEWYGIGPGSSSDFRASIRAFWSNDNSDFYGVYERGPMSGRVCFIDHEESNLMPTHRSVESFLRATLRSLDAPEDREELSHDYLAVRDASDEEERDDLAVIEQLERLYASAPDDEERYDYLRCIMNLTPWSRTRDIVRFLDVPDMWVQEHVCEILGLRKQEWAVDRLAEVARHGLHNGRTAAMMALGAIGTPAARQHLVDLVSQLPRGYEAMLGHAMKAAGIEAKFEKRGAWYYRVSSNDEWRALKCQGVE